MKAVFNVQNANVRPRSNTLTFTYTLAQPEKNRIEDKPNEIDTMG